MNHLLEEALEKCLGGNSSNWNIETSSYFNGFDIRFLKYILQRFAGSVLTPGIRETWIISLCDVKDIVGFDCVLLTTIFLPYGRTAIRFATNFLIDLGTLTYRVMWLTRLGRDLSPVSWDV
jgi:hypothetical protein